MNPALRLSLAVLRAATAAENWQRKLESRARWAIQRHEDGDCVLIFDRGSWQGFDRCQKSSRRRWNWESQALQLDSDRVVRKEKRITILEWIFEGFKSFELLLSEIFGIFWYQIEDQNDKAILNLAWTQCSNSLWEVQRAHKISLAIVPRRWKWAISAYKAARHVSRAWNVAHNLPSFAYKILNADFAFLLARCFWLKKSSIKGIPDFSFLDAGVLAVAVSLSIIIVHSLFHKTY